LTLRLAVISPFLDRRHGTERALTELLERLVRNHAYEVHLYAQNVEGIAVSCSQESSAESPSSLVWHRVPKIPGPHLLQFLFWITANRLCRLRDRLFRGIRFDAVFSPGINALDADVIMVHAVFHRLTELQDAHPQDGLRGLHRRLYYRFLCFLETLIYHQNDLRLAAVSRHTATQLKHYFGRNDVHIVPNGVDLSHFSLGNRIALRSAARQKLRYSPDEVVLLLVGNDLRNKGLAVLLESLQLCRNIHLRLCVVGRETSADIAKSIDSLQVADRVIFAGETSEVLTFYAAADIYVAPSLEDSFNLPALEAMACGLPVVVSRNAGISDYLNDGVDSLLLRDPQDPHELVCVLKRLLDDDALVATLSANALTTAATLSWDRHAESVHRLLTEDLSSTRTCA